MKVISLKSISLLLFAILTLQFSGITCFGEEVVCLDNAQIESHWTTAGSDHTSDSSCKTDDCPCHLSFNTGLPVIETSYSPIVTSVIPSNHQQIKNIASIIFQPPKTIL